MSLLIMGLATMDGFIVITYRRSFKKFSSLVLIRLVWLRYRHLKMSKFKKKSMAIRTLSDTEPDDGPTLKTSAFECLYGGQFTLPTQLIKPNYQISQGCPELRRLVRPQSRLHDQNKYMVLWLEYNFTIRMKKVQMIYIRFYHFKS